MVRDIIIKTAKIVIIFPLLCTKVAIPTSAIHGFDRLPAAGTVLAEQTIEAAPERPENQWDTAAGCILSYRPRRIGDSKGKVMENV